MRTGCTRVQPISGRELDRMMVTHPQSQGAAVDTLTPRKSGDKSNFIEHPETWTRDRAPLKDLTEGPHTPGKV
jgi:hypothetical protein